VKLRPRRRILSTRKLGKPVFCIPGLGRLDDCAALIVADALRRKDSMLVFPVSISEVDAGNADTVWKSRGARLSFTVRKFSRRVLSIVVCRLGKSNRSRGGATA
jgi:hypothetical protein